MRGLFLTIGLAVLLTLVGCTPTSTPTPLPTNTPTPLPTFTPTPTLTPTPTPEPTPSPTPSPTPTPEPIALVNVKSLALRAGPGTVYPVLDGLEYRQALKVIGRDAKGDWLKVQTEDDREGWVSAEYVELQGLLESIPVLEAPPTPMPTPTPTPTPSLPGRLLFQLHNEGPIYEVNLDGTGLQQLTWGMDPKWSPQGDSIAFARWSGATKGIWLKDLTTGEERPIFANPHTRTPYWSPDGSQIVFTRQHGGRLHEETRCFFGRCFTLSPDPHWKLGVVNVRTGSFRDLPCDEHSFAPSWSPDGKYIVYDGDRGLNIVSVDGSAPSPLTSDPLDAYPVWSPNGARIAFMHRQHDHWEIYVMNADGTNRRSLTPPPVLGKAYNNVAPAWSPDGRYIVFLTDRSGRWEVYIMNADGTDHRPLMPDVLGELEFRYDFSSERVLDWIAP